MRRIGGIFTALADRQEVGWVIPFVTLLARRHGAVSDRDVPNSRPDVVCNLARIKKQPLNSAASVYAPQGAGSDGCC